MMIAIQVYGNMDNQKINNVNFVDNFFVVCLVSEVWSIVCYLCTWLVKVWVIEDTYIFFQLMRFGVEKVYKFMLLGVLEVLWVMVMVYVV